MSHIPPDFNPYASPSEADGRVKQPVVSSYEMLKDVKRFRAEIHALAALWIVIGSLPLALGVFLGVDGAIVEYSFDELVGAAIFTAIGLPVLICGVFTGFKHVWAVYLGLVLSYLLAILGLFGFNLCVAVIYASGIFGGHRILSWAREFHRKGIPLTTRPRDIQVPLGRPTFLP